MLFILRAVEFLESLKVKRYKVASRTCLFKDPYSLETLKAKSSTKKPIIFSMGMGGSIQKIKNIFRKNKTTCCYCISKYPLGFNEINWKKAVKYNGFFGSYNGYHCANCLRDFKKTTECDKHYD